MPDEIIVGSTAVEVVPSARTFIKKLAAQIDPQIRSFGKEIGRILSDKIADSIKKGMVEGFAGAGPLAKRQGQKSGEDFGGSFSRTAKTRIEAALKSLPKAQIGVATTRAEQQLKDLRAEMQALLGKEIGVDIDSAAAAAKIDELKLRLDALAAESPDIQVRVDTLGASAQLAAFRAEMMLLNGGGGEGASSGGGMFASMAESLGKSASATGPLVIGIGAIGLALIPVVASAAGLAAALVAPLVAAGGGLTIFGLLAGTAIGRTNKVAKQIDDLKKKADTLVDPKARAAAAAQAKALEESLTRPQRAFLKAKETLSKAFGKVLGGKTGDALFAPIVSGMNLLAKVMPGLSPIIVSVSTAISGLLDDLSRSADGKGFKGFVQGFADLAGGTITSAGKMVGSFGKGLFNIFRDFLPLSKSVGGGLEDMGKRFERWTQKDSTKKGIAKFMDYVKENGPKVLDSIGQFTESVVRFGIALAPVGTKIIEAFTAMFRAFNSIPPELLRGVLSPIQTIGKAAWQMGDIFVAVFNYGIRPSIIGIGGALGALMVTWGTMLRALGHVPGFGWAKDAGKAMVDAGLDALHLGESIKAIPPNWKLAFTTSGYEAAIKQITQMNEAARKSGSRVHYSAGHGGGLTRADGGLIFGPGTGRSDSVPVMASNGEFIVNAAATRDNLALLHAINAKKYADGGLVGMGAAAFGAGVANSGPAPVVLSASLVGARARLVGPDLIEFVDGRIEAMNAAQSGHSNSQRRAGHR